MIAKKAKYVIRHVTEMFNVEQEHTFFISWIRGLVNSCQRKFLLNHVQEVQLCWLKVEYLAC